jgi:hypothetical protein
MYKNLAGVLAAGLLLTGCSNSRPVTSKTEEDTTITSDCGTAGSLSWKKNTRTKTATDAASPASYSEYTVAGATGFFERAKEGPQDIMVPLPDGCRAFKTSLSETMSPELRKKYPQLVSLKGSNDAGDDLRLDWDGSTFRGQVLTAAGGKTYLITPLTGTATNYMVYDRADSRDPKQPFEKIRSAPPAGTQQRVSSPQADK